jgi:cytosine/adenosine deaminase-related metal-dependent hydrolase
MQQPAPTRLKKMIPDTVRLPDFDRHVVSLSARWIFPVSGPPLENGTIGIADGRITAIHADDVQPTYNLGNVAIIPGLVNAHTHLELSDAAAPLTPAVPFASWLRAVVFHRRVRGETAGADDLAVAAGRTESLCHGTTTIGDIVGRPSTGSTSPGSGAIRTVAFLELLGLAPERRDQQLQRAREHLASNAGDQSVIRGLSPHAPYSVHPELLRGSIDLAVEHGAPVAMHLAETVDELELLAHGSGEFVRFLQDLGVWRDDAIPQGSRPLDYLRELSRVTRALVIHGNFLSDEELDYIAAHPSLSVVYCPRTHAYFGYAPHPWRRMLSRGINVALGTDSRASNPDLSLFAELRLLRRLAPDFDLAGLLQLGTINGASALGLAAETGSLAVGKSADLAIVALPDVNSSDPYSLLFDPQSRVVATVSARRTALGPGDQ